MTAPAAYRTHARNIDPAADNAIHDDQAARRLGFGGALVPGVELFAYLTSPLVGAWGVSFLGGGRLDVRFRRPVYDGEEVVADAVPTGENRYVVSLTGVEGVPRAVGHAAPDDDGPAVDTAAYATVALPAQLVAPDPDSLRVGPLGTVTEHVDTAAGQGYLDAIGEPLSVYREGDLAHPGLLLRLVNAVLMRNVALGPWIHTASDCRLLAVAQLPATLTAHGVVTDLFERAGRSWIRYDALVCSDGVPVMEVAHSAIYHLGPEPSPAP